MGQTLSVDEHNERLLKTLVPGDIVKFKRGLYSHFAIYIGKGKVIHLTGPDNGHGISSNIRSRHVASLASVPVDKAEVREEDFKTAAGQDKAYKANKEDWKSFDTEEILEKAKSKIGEAEYNALTQNCEHFVYELKYGKKRSFEVPKCIAKVGGIALACIGGGVGAIAAGIITIMPILQRALNRA